MNKEDFFYAQKFTGSADWLDHTWALSGSSSPTVTDPTTIPAGKGTPISGGSLTSGSTTYGGPLNEQVLLDSILNKAKLKGTLGGPTKISPVFGPTPGLWEQLNDEYKKSKEKSEYEKCVDWLEGKTENIAPEPVPQSLVDKMKNASYLAAMQSQMLDVANKEHILLKPRSAGATTAKYNKLSYKKLTKAVADTFFSKYI